MSFFYVRLLAALSISAVAVVSPVTASVASADPNLGKLLVVMGDSYTATAPVLGSAADGCVRSPTSWPAQLAASARVIDTPNFLDVSCNGGSIDTGDGFTLVQQARKASAQAAFGTGTRAVMIQAGMNDIWGGSNAKAFPSVDCLLNLVQGCGFDAVDQGRVPDYRAVTGQSYADRIRSLADYVRYYAPNAQVVIVGYPEVYASGQSDACLDIAGAGRVVQPNAKGYIAFLDSLQAAQRDAAALLGVAFFDARSVTQGHGSCSAEPWVGGLTEPNSLYIGAPEHPTAYGNGVVAAALQRQFSL